MSSLGRFLTFALFSTVCAASGQTVSKGLFGITQVWKYQQTTNFDGVNWTTPGFDDSAWPSGSGLLFVETNPSVTPRNTALTLGRNTYYFRAHFQFTNGISGGSLVFSNLIDDGAVFYLNGIEVQRVRMPVSPALISYATLASSSPLPIGDATSYDVFTLTGDSLTNVINGDNVLAVEVHQRIAGDSDIVWGAALSALVYTGAMTFVTQPTDTSALDGRPASFSARAIAEPDPAYQWFKDGTPIPGATNRIYSLAAAYPSHGGNYFVQASNASAVLISSNASLGVIGDFDPPIPLSATGAKDLVTISIPFNETPYPASAMDTSHFAVLADGPGSAPVQVLSAVLANQTNVLLTTTPRTLRADYVVHVAGVHDYSSRSNMLATDLPLRSVVDVVTIDSATTWRFDDSGAEPLANWLQTSFDDSGWSNGAGVFYAGTQAGFLPAPARTTVALTNRFDANRVLTYYFRLQWEFPGEPATASLRVRYIVDDGAAFYLNGSEIHSARLPAARPLFSTNLATAFVGTPVYEPPTNQSGITLSTSNLHVGQNVLAVEVHQNISTSPDVAFAATLEATIERFSSPVRLQIPTALSELAGAVNNGGTASIDAPLPTNLVVSLASSLSASAAVPAAVVIPSGATNVSFGITVTDDTLLNGTRPVVISARAPGYSTGRATLVINDDETAALTLTLPESLLEGAAKTATLSLNRAPTYAAVVSLVSGNPALSVPASATIPPGSTSTVFNISAPDDLVLNGARLATLTAQFPNWISATGSVAVVDNELTNLVLALPATFTEADGVRTNAGRVSLLGMALSNTVISLQSSSPGELSIPASAIVLAGQTNALFDVTTSDDASTNGTRTVVVTASASGFAGTQSSVTLYDDDPAQVTFTHVASPQYAGKAFTLGLAAYDITGRLITNFGGPLMLNAASPTGAVSVLPSSVSMFTNGRWSGSVTIPSSATFVRLSCPPLVFTSDPFQVESWPMRTNFFPAQNIVHSPLTKLIYGSVPSYAATNPNTVTAFDPVGGTNVWSLPVGEILRGWEFYLRRSGRLALADNGQHLFVTASNAAIIRRLDVLNRTITGSFSPSGLSVEDLTPLAGSSTALAVALAANPLEPSELVGVAVYDNGVLRSNIGPGAMVLKPGPATLYGFRPNFDTPVATFNFSRYAVTSSGASILDTTGGLIPFTSYLPELAQVDGLVYSPTGEVLDPTNRVVLATLQPGGGRVAPDPASGRVFIAGYSGASYFIQAHDAKTFLPLKQFLIPGGGGEIINLVRYGTNGLAMHTYGDFLYLIESPLLFPGGPVADLRLTQSHAPEPPLVGNNLTFNVHVTNAGPADAFEATITDTVPTNSVFVSANVTRGIWTNESGTIRAELGYFPAGASATLTLTVRPTIASTIANRALVIANEYDTNLLNNVATNSTYVRISLVPDSYAAVSLTTRDIVFDPVTDRIYASIPSSATGISNQLVPIDPGTGVIEAGWNAGNEPGKLVLIPPGGRIYAAVNTNYVVSRINLSSRTKELSFALNSNAPPADYTVLDFTVMPNAPETLAALRFQYFRNTEVCVYDSNGIPRPNVALYTGTFQITAATDGNSVYGTSGDGRVMRGYTVDAQGVTERYIYAGIYPLVASRRWSSVDTRLLGSDGLVIDPSVPRVLAAVPGISLDAISCYDAGRGRFFFLTLSNTWLLRAIDARTLAPLQELSVTNVLGTPSSLVRVRNDGFAFRTDLGQLFLLRGAAAGHGMTADLAINSQTPTPRVALGSNITILVTATNRGPGSASNTIVSVLVPSSLAIVTSSIPHSVYSVGLLGLKFNLGSFASGASTNITITLRATAAGVSQTIAAVTGNAEDLDQSNNVTSEDALVVFPPGWTGISFVPVPGLDLAYDRGRNLMYLSSGAESVAVVSPETGEMLGSILVGPSTGRLKITDNGEFLYVTVSNGTGIARINLANGARDLLFGLGLNSLANPYLVTDLEPLPGSPHSVVVGKGPRSDGLVTVTLYDDGVARPLSPLDLSGADYLEFAGSPNRVYANGSGFSFRRYRVMAITTDGVEEIAGTENVPNVLGDFEFGGGLFYATTGDILAPETGMVVGHINGLGAGTLVEPDTSQARVFFLAPIAGTTWQLLAYEFGGLSPVASVAVSSVVGTPVNLVRWGTNRFAFNTTSNVLYLIKMDATVQFTSLLSKTVAVASQPLSLQWRLSNGGPASLAVTVSNRVPDFASFAGGSAGSGLLLQTNGSVLWTLTNLANNTASTADVQLLFTNGMDVLVTNQSSSFATLPNIQSASNGVTLVFRVLADNDHNGLGDTWELNNFGSLGVPPAADADGDGLSNQQEFTTGTDPHDAMNALRIVSFTVIGNTASLRFFAVRGQDYAVERASFVNGPWFGVHMVSGESIPVTWTDSINLDARFYRVRRVF